MLPKRRPTEFGINMFLEKIMVLQQDDLDNVNSYNYFDENSPCHLYFVCRRPRVTIIPEKYIPTKDKLIICFKVQIQDKFEEHIYELENPFEDENITLETKYPFSFFELKKGGETLLKAKSATFVQSIDRNYTNATFIDLEILYIGQSYGVDGARTAPDRLKNHSTLLGIYSNAIQKNPDSEIWLVLTTFKQLNLFSMSGKIDYSDEELTEDKENFLKVYNKLTHEGLNEQQKINFTEAALIKYFQPPYNKEYKYTFPNPAHSTYSECYDLDINTISVELETIEKANFQFYSEAVKSNWYHIGKFLLHSKEERVNMFEII